MDYDNDEVFVKDNLLTYIKKMHISRDKFNSYLEYYPDSIYKTLYKLEVSSVFA